jgi:thiol:disulfide interchange protein DsbD
MRCFRLIFAFVVVLGAALSAAAQLSAPASSPKDTKAAFDAPHLRVELLVPRDQLYLAEWNDAGLYFKLEPGWHVYWQNAGDSGEPPHIHWTLPKGFSVTPMQFPAPQRLPLGPLMDFGYENEVLFPLKLSVTSEIERGKEIGAVGPFPLRAKIDWLVCREVCIPGKAELEVERKVWIGLATLVDTRGPTLAEKFFGAKDNSLPALPVVPPEGNTTIFQPTPTGFRLAVSTGQRETQAEFFPEDENILDNPALQNVTPTATGLILDLKKDANLKSLPTQLKGVLELSGGRNYEIVASPGDVAEPLFTARPGAVPPAAPVFPLATLAGTAFFAFLGGLLLNLMPCVFPVLFLKGLALVNSGSEERHKLRAHGFVYTAGILVSFWVLVAALLALRGAGATLGWGFQFQSPIFLSLMAGLLFFLGLSLAGQFEIGLTLTSAGGALAAKQGYAGSFFTGVLAVVVATPCTAPFMGAAIGYALAQPAAVTFVVFTALALGLAAPYIALTLQPAWTRLLPKPGAWMDILKQAVSVPILATVIWLTWVVAQAYGAALVAALLASFLLLAIAGWFLGRWPAKRWATATTAAILVLTVSFIVFASRAFVTPRFSTHKVLTIRGAPGSYWQPWSADAVNRSLAAGQPVFVDFTASWCLSCQVNEHVALDQPKVMQAFVAHGVALFKADWTRQDPAITDALTALGRSGVPVYALYTPGQSTPQLLPQVLTPGIVTDALSKLPKASATQSAADSSKQK